MNNVKYSDNGVFVNISFFYHGEPYLISNPISKSSNGKNLMVFDSYIVVRKEFSKIGTDIDYYVNKIDSAVGYLKQNFSIQDIIRKLIREHISSHGRIIDNDLMMIASVLSQVLQSIKTGSVLNENYMEKSLIGHFQNEFKEKMADDCLSIATREFGDNLFMTKYVYGSMGIQATIVSYNSNMKI